MIKTKQKDELKKGILEILSNELAPLSTQDLSLKLEKPWHSIQTRCLMLQIDGKVNGYRVGRINLWQIKN